jgi:hypothetical protein
VRVGCRARATRLLACVRIYTRVVIASRGQAMAVGRLTASGQVAPGDSAPASCVRALIIIDIRLLYIDRQFFA